MIKKLILIIGLILLLPAQSYAYLVEDGFETGDYTEWPSQTESNGANDIESTAPIYKGSYSSGHTITLATGQAYLTNWNCNETTMYFRVYFYFDAALDVDNYLVIILANEYADPWDANMGLCIDGNEKLYAYNYVTDTVEGTSASAIEKGKWVCIEMKVVSHNTAGEVRVWYEGNEVITSTGIDTVSSSASMYGGHFGIIYTSATEDINKIKLHMDNCIIDNSYVGPDEEPAVLQPIINIF